MPRGGLPILVAQLSCEIRLRPYFLGVRAVKRKIRNRELFEEFVPRAMSGGCQHERIAATAHEYFGTVYEELARDANGL